MPRRKTASPKTLPRPVSKRPADRSPAPPVAPPKAAGAGPSLAAAERLGHRLEDLPPPPEPSEDREALALARLRRAAERSKKRSQSADVPAAARKRAEILARKNFAEISKSRGNREVLETPSGKARFGRGKFNTQPYITLDREDWGEGQLPKHNYDAIVSALPKEGEKVQGIADEIGGFLATDAPPKPTSHAQTRAEKAGATLLSGLLAVAEPHEERNPVGGKPERAAIRRAGKVGFEQVFNRKKGEYVPAWAVAGGAKIGGTQAWREIRGGTRSLPPRTLALLDDMSASSTTRRKNRRSHRERPEGGLERGKPLPPRPRRARKRPPRKSAREASPREMNPKGSRPGRRGENGSDKRRSKTRPSRPRSRRNDRRERGRRSNSAGTSSASASS